MRQAYWFAAASIAVMILASAGGWTILTAPAGATNAVGASLQVDPMQAMKNAKNLPAAHYDDYSVVFN
jgi:hypothetical protein